MKRIAKTLFIGLFIAAASFSCGSDDSTSNKPEVVDPTPGPGPEPEPGVKTYEHKVLIEDFTGTWCGPCSVFLKALDDLEKVNTEHKVIVAAIHCSDKMQLTNQFPFFPFYQQMKKKIENETITDSYSIPFAIINRKATWGYPPSKNLEQPLGLVQKSSTVGIKLESVLGETTGTVQFTLAFSEDYKDLKYVVYILEDDVIDTQVGFTGNYNHKDVVRATVDSFKGVAIPSDKTAKNATFVSETFALTYKKANVDNLKVVVAVLNENDDVINAQQAKGNTAKDFVVISE